MSEPDARPPARSEQAVQELLERRASDNERVVSALRIGLVCASIARSVWVWGTHGTLGEPTRALLLGAAGLAAILFSLHVLVAYRRRRVPAALLAGSVTLDAAVCFAALLVNPLWPGPGYPGLMYMPDLAALMVVMIGGGLRLSPRIALLSAALNFLSFGVLVWVDRGRGAAPGMPFVEPFLLWAILLPVTATATVLVARLLRSLAYEGAVRGVEAERARRGLDAVLEDHHDVRTVLSSAALNTDLLLRELRDTDGAQGAASSEVAEALAEDLSQVNDFVRAIRERAWGELSALHEPAPVDPRATVHSVFRELEGRFEARFALRDDTDGARVLVAGGEPTLRRILRNLVVNACEGDGARAAARVEVRFARTNSARGVEVAVEDDGPGFRSDVLREEPGSRATTKSGGSGLGLLLVETLLGPHAASLRRSNRDEGGARVSFELPEAPV